MVDNSTPKSANDKKGSFLEFLNAANPKPSGMYGAMALYARFIKTVLPHKHSNKP